MSNLFDYVAWRGDLPMELVPFGEADALALSQLSYVPYEKVMGPQEALSLRTLWERTDGPILGGSTFQEENQRFFQAAAQSERFGSLVLERYEHAFDPDLDMQFAAVTFRLPGDFAYAAFRGTDRTLVGWKEDLRMAFEPIPAQGKAANYLARVLESHVGPVMVGGHSKGGNLALYAASTLPEDLQRHIAAVYVHDGPGLREELASTPGYALIQKRLHVYLPRQAVFGLLLNHPEEYTVVQSTAVSLMQHDPYTWQIQRDRFETADSLDPDSIYWETVFRKWLAETGEEEFLQAVDALFQVAGASEAANINEVLPRLVQNPMATFHALRDMDPLLRQKILSVLGSLAGTAIAQVGQSRNQGKLPKPEEENEEPTKDDAEES